MPQDQNRYAYVANNPTRYTDPTGHDFWSDLFTALAVIAIAITAVLLVVAIVALVAYAVGAISTAAFMSIAVPMIAAAGSATITSLAVGAGSAIGAAIVGDDPGQAFVQGFAYTFGPAIAGSLGAGWYRSHVRPAKGAIAETKPTAVVKEQPAPLAGRESVRRPTVAVSGRPEIEIADEAFMRIARQTPKGMSHQTWMNGIKDIAARGFRAIVTGERDPSLFVLSGTSEEFYAAGSVGHTVVGVTVRNLRIVGAVVTTFG